MFLAWDRRKKPLRCFVLLFLAVVFASTAFAQEPPKPRILSARTIILPPKLIAGSPATLAVLDSAGRLLPQVAVEFSTGQKVTTDATGRALFLAPSEAGKLIAKISGREITASTPVVAPAASAMQSSAGMPTEGLHVISYPHALTIHDRFAVEGTGFRGAADSNHVFLADQPCLVVASSPVSLVVLPGPRIPTGAINLHIGVAGNDSGQIPVSAVLLEFSGPTEASDAGSQGKIILSVHGAAEPLSVEVRNGSPSVIQFPHGNVQRLTTSGGEQNMAPVELKFLAAGNYTVTARLIPTNTASPTGRSSLGMTDVGHPPGPKGRP
jgi:hypothetical protein